MMAHFKGEFMTQNYQTALKAKYRINDVSFKQAKTTTNETIILLNITSGTAV
jgi:hypothetical protein